MPLTLKVRDSFGPRLLNVQLDILLTTTIKLNSAQHAAFQWLSSVMDYIAISHMDARHVFAKFTAA